MGVRVSSEMSPHAAAGRRQVVLLGSTGSIGTSCLDVLEHLGERFTAYGLSAHTRWEELLRQVQRHAPRFVTVTDPAAEEQLARQALPPGTQLLRGKDALARLVTAPEVDIVLTAIVGAAGLEGTWHALEAGKSVAVANKETLVMAGPLVMELARQRGARVLPVDSEHSAIFQALQGSRRGEVRRVVLTARGGPFRGRRKAELADVTPAEALKHPTWSMGPKITVDSATLMNKALEIIE